MKHSTAALFVCVSLCSVVAADNHMNGDMMDDISMNHTMMNNHSSMTTMLSEEDYEAMMLDMFNGCGDFQDLPASQEYTQINLQMHELMAINFTGTNAQFDFAAGMIPHHSAAVEMCNTYNTHHDPDYNEGIASLCYNITYGPKDMGIWQYDFSQPGEVAQLLDVIRGEGLLERHESGCQSLTHMQKQALAVNMSDYGSHSTSSTNSNIMNTMGNSGTTSNMLEEPHPSSQNHHHGSDSEQEQPHNHGMMFMGCGNLEHAMTQEYLKANHDMHMYMSLQWSGSADIDFLLGMIPHHEGAIAMCRIYYTYWECAPRRSVCVDPIPLEDLTRMIAEGQAVSTLNLMHHMCMGHILYTQPREVEWMKAELERISPVHLRMYEKMKEQGVYPCQGAVLDLGTWDSGDDGDDATSVASKRKAQEWILAVTATLMALVVV